MPSKIKVHVATEITPSRRGRPRKKDFKLSHMVGHKLIKIRGKKFLYFYFSSLEGGIDISHSYGPFPKLIVLFDLQEP